MVKKKAKKQSKRKKTEKESKIRTDVWQLVMTSKQRQLAILTVAEYRYFLKPLVLISYWNWGKLSQLNSNERVNTQELLIHKTADNPNPKYYWYFHKAVGNHPSFRKFPSYLRRAAIQDALGIVSSFVTRWDAWKRGERKHRYDQPPRLTAMCNSYPALYKGQQVKYHSNFDAVDLKVWSGTDWGWMTNIPVKKHGKSVGSSGTVKARKFINPARDIDRRDQRKQRIARASKLTRKITNQDLPKGFCQGLYRKSKNINKHIAQSVSRQIVEFAQKHHVSVIVFEDLSNWKAKGGKHGSLSKQRFHQWCKDKLVELTIQKFSELGGKVSKVNPKYTSAYAFDGSGLIKRSNQKYSQAVFQNGKRYNADLSASYNIGARYWYAILTNSKFTRVWEGRSMPSNKVKGSSQTLRTPVTLSTLWGLSKA
ncbi:MAG: IS200/IS605 family accessory protein TnpB-related protein [Coleofasciculus sp.]|uniref:IS200/IS605 family accessory protein TnpB-related protein n=1 Tax=Coleofasciculus sp. TaxID=3100458 RepID=UPI003A337654